MWTSRFVVLVLLLGAPRAADSTERRGDSGWGKTYQPTAFEWFVMGLNVDSGHDCASSKTSLKFFQEPNNTLGISAHSEEGANDGERRTCLERLFGNLQSSASLGWNLSPPPVRLILTGANLPAASFQIIYDCHISRISRGPKGWEQSGKTLVTGLPFSDVCHETSRVPSWK
jgi:hypothetical protein